MQDETIRKKIGKIWENDENHRRCNCKTLSELYEGAIRKHVEYRIKSEIKDKKEQEEIASRILEIEIVKRIVDKLAKAYKDNPVRRLCDATPIDEEMFEWYLENINFDELGRTIDKNYNNYKEALVQCIFHLKSQKPRVKIWEPSEYIAVTDDTQDISNATIFVTHFGKSEDNEEMLFCVTEEEVWIQNIRGDLLKNEMSDRGNVDGNNLYGRIPFVYANRSKTETMPYPDESMISVATLIPMLCGDINYAIKYMSYAIIYGINVKEEMVRRGPNAFFNLIPFDPESPNKPEVGVLKPDIDIQEVFNGIMQQLQLWLNSRGISASVLGYNSTNISSGLSKMIDEADVSAMISQNQEVYRNMERSIFDFIMHYGHNLWKMNNPEIPQGSFSPECYVEVNFPKVEVIKSRDEIIKEVKEELSIGLTSKKRAIKRLNPNMSDDEIEELLEEINEEKKPIEEVNKVEEIIPAENPAIKDMEDIEYGSGLAED
jgi:arsenate reductase-like glutaredoxin family protein